MSEISQFYEKLFCPYYVSADKNVFQTIPVERTSEELVMSM